MIATNQPAARYRIGPIRGFGSLIREFVRAVTFLAAHVGIKVDSDDITSATATIDGIRARFASSAASAADRPLHVAASGLVTPGRICGAMPAIVTTPIDDSPAPTLTLTGTGTEYVIATVLATADVSTLDGNDFTRPAMTGVSAALSVTGTLPTADDLVDTPAAGFVSFKIHLATFVDGVKTAQNGYGPITGYLQDNYDGTGECLLVLIYPGES